MGGNHGQHFARAAVTNTEELYIHSSTHDAYHHPHCHNGAAPAGGPAPAANSAAAGGRAGRRTPGGLSTQTRCQTRGTWRLACQTRAALSRQVSTAERERLRSAGGCGGRRTRSGRGLYGEEAAGESASHPASPAWPGMRCVSVGVRAQGGATWSPSLPPPAGRRSLRHIVGLGARVDVVLRSRSGFVRGTPYAQPAAGSARAGGA